MKPALLLAAGLLLWTSGFSQNIGIGTTTPLFKLDVRNGSINADSVYRIGAVTVLGVHGSGNLFIGKDAGRINTGFFNTFSGDHAGYSNTTGFENSFFGRSAGSSTTTGYDNSFFGQNAGYTNTTGYDNSFFGRESGYENITGYYNSFFGQAAGHENTTGYYNSFFGQAAGYYNTTGNYNSFFGWKAGFSNTSGNNNSFFGLTAGYDNTTGLSNSFFGRNAGFANTSGDNNSFFGQNAGYTNTFGTRNTAIGSSTYFSPGELTNATVIGYNASVDASNKVRLGNTSVTSIGGQVGWTSFSDGRFKHQIQEDVQGLAFIKKLHPVSFMVDLIALDNYHSTGNSEIEKSSSFQSPELYRQSGFIAQEVEQAANELGFSFSGIDKPQNEKALYGLRYGDFVVPLVKAVQEQQAIIEQQNTILEKQNKIVEQQNKKIEMLIKEITLIKEKLR